MNNCDFDSKRISQYCLIQRKVKTLFPDIKICNNSHLIMEKLIQVKSNNPTVVECGVYKGGTLISTKFFADENNINLNLIGADSFNGFPSKKHNEKDLPSYFKELYRDKKITKEHFLKTQEITNKLKEDIHLTEEYFRDNFDTIFEFCKNNDINLIKGYFKDVLDKIDQTIDILYLDCDLYDSYIVCLNKLYNKVATMGVVIFDEYYSLKYPGPRAAVDEFFRNKIGHFEKYLTNDSFERWCFIKEE